MDPVLLFLLGFATIFIVGIAGELVFERTSVPDVVWLLLVGILIGPVFGVVRREDLMAVGPYFGALTLVVVLFDGGRQLRLGDVSRSLPRASLLAVSGFLFNVVVMALASLGAAALGFLPSQWTVMHGVILGAILGGSSSVVIMPALAKARLEPRLSAMVSLESALTDVLCVVVTVACIDIVASGSGGMDRGAIILGRSFGIGLGTGLAAGLLWVLFMGLIRRVGNAYAATLSILLLLFVGVSLLGGNAALAILAAAIVVGNAPALSQALGFREPVALDDEVQDTHSQVTFIVKSFFFTFIGAMLGPPWGLVALGLLFAVLLFLARVPAAALSTWGGGFTPAERQLVGVMMPRGMAAGVLALMPYGAGVPGTEFLPVVAFSVVLGSIAIFAVGFPLARRGAAAPPPGASPPGAPPASSEPAGPLAERPTEPGVASAPAREGG
ncbi:MAG TPA: cation:proton antiporter [Polyangiaceae bacterium]|nr:cation:proton antiporter [Polyangiaceae bacterium]